MTTSTISNTLLKADGVTPCVGVRVRITLIPGGAFVSATGVEVAPTIETETNGSGAWSVALERNSGITPANSFYKVEELLSAADGGPRVCTIQVGSSNQSLLAALVSPIPSITSQNYLTQAAADARYIQSPLGYANAGESRPGDAASGGSGTDVARANHVHDREIISGTAAARAALTGTDLFEGLRFRETDGSDKLYEYRAAAWLQRGDFFIVADAAARTAITTPYEGMCVVQMDTNIVYRYDGSNWIAVEYYGNLTDYTPTLTQSATVTKNVLGARYWRQGKQVVGNFTMSVTGTGTAANAILVGAPVSSATDDLFNHHCGTAQVWDSSAVVKYRGILVWNSAGVWKILTLHSTTDGYLGASDFVAALANNDIVSGQFQYMAASAS